MSNFKNCISKPVSGCWAKPPKTKPPSVSSIQENAEEPMFPIGWVTSHSTSPILSVFIP